MRGEVTLESRDKFEAFLTRLQEEQQLNTFEPSADEEE
jgi:hypothetical protein